MKNYSGAEILGKKLQQQPRAQKVHHTPEQARKRMGLKEGEPMPKVNA